MIFMPSEAMLTPPLKWPGGKRWLRNIFCEIAPQHFNNYIEPFAGGASIFFAIQPERAVLNDINRELISTYQALRDDWRSVYNLLLSHQKNHSSAYYYEMRNYRPRTLPATAARMLYLNRTCFNGIYRVNLEGNFNVPIGTKTNVLLESDDFESVASVLQSATLLVRDFETVIDAANEGDLIFADPPYTVRHNFNGFVKYNETLFAWEDQVRLSQALIRAVQRDVYVISTNAYHRSVMELYRRNNFTLRNLSRYSSISAGGQSRMNYEELLICSVNIP